MGRIYDVHISAHKYISDDMAKRYYPFTRKDLHKIKRWRLILIGIYIFPLRVLAWFIAFYYAIIKMWIIFRS